MDTEQQESGKKPKIVTKLEIIDVDQPLNQEVHIPTYGQEENPQLESSSEQSQNMGKLLKGMYIKSKTIHMPLLQRGNSRARMNLWYIMLSRGNSLLLKPKRG